MPASRTSRTRLTPLAAMGLWLSCVVVLSLLASAVLLGVRRVNGPLAVDPNQGLWGLPEQKSAALRQIYSGQPPALVHPRKDEIEAFLTDLTKPDEQNTSKWETNWDGERFRDRAAKSNSVQSLSRPERQTVAKQQISEFWRESPAHFVHLKLVHIAPWSEFGRHGNPKPLDDELIVFAYGKRRYDDLEPVVFWLHGPVGQLKLLDWEFVAGGIAESEEAGLYESANRDRAADQLFLFYQYLREIDGLNYTDREKFEQKMNLAELCQVPKVWEDRARYLLMVRWSNWSRSEEVCRLAEKVKNPDAIPGVLALHATSCSRLGQDEQALALIARSDNLIGFRPDLSEMRARLLTNTRRDEALVEWRRLVDFDSSDVSHLSQLFQLLPKSNRFEVIEKIKSQPDSAKLSVSFAQYNAYRLTESMFQELSRHVASVAPDSNEACELEVLRLRNQGDFAASAQLNRQAAEREADPQLKQTRWESFLSDMHSAGQIEAGFDAHPDPKAAFDTLVSGLEHGEGTIDIDELPPVLAAYRKHRPDDPRLSFYEGYFAADQQDYQKADEYFLAAERLASQDKQPAENEPPAKSAELEGDDDEHDYLLSMICRERCRVRYELGDDVEILAQYPKREEAYRALAEKAFAYRHWAVLDRINQAFRQDEPSNPWLAYYSGRLAIAKREFAVATDQLRDMATQEAKSPEMKYLRTQLQRDLVSAQNPDPLRRFELSEEKTSAFHQISDALLDEQDWTKLDQLCLRHPDGPDSPDVAMIRLEQAWKQDHAKVVQLLTPWPEKLFARNRYQAPHWRNRLVRSLLRLQRRDEAMAVAQDAKQRFGEVWPMLLTSVANRDSKKIEQLLSEDDSEFQPWQFQRVSDDPELRPLLVDDAFANVRTRHPFHLPVYEYGPTLSILLSKPCDISEEWLSSRLTESKTPGSNSQPSLQISRVSSTRFVVNWNQTRFLLTSVAKPCFPADFLAAPAITKRLPDMAPETATLLEKQQAYWQIVSLGDSNGDQWNPTDHHCRQFAARLLNDDVVGIMHRSWFPTGATVLPIDATQADKLSGRQPLLEIDGNAVILPHRQTNPLKLSDEKRQTLRTIAPNDDATKRIIATVQLAGGNQPWLEKFQFLEFKSNRYGEQEIIAEYCGQDYSNTLPELRPGIRYIIPIDNVIDITQD